MHPLKAARNLGADGLVPNPLGTIAILSAFNFPVAVYGWNLAIAIATGNTTLWKPSPTTPLVSVAVTKLIAPILEKNGLPGSVAALICGDRDVGETLVANKEIQMGMSSLHTDSATKG